MDTKAVYYSNIFAITSKPIGLTLNYINGLFFLTHFCLMAGLVNGREREERKMELADIWQWDGGRLRRKAIYNNQRIAANTRIIAVMSKSVTVYRAGRWRRRHYILIILKNYGCSLVSPHTSRHTQKCS